MRSLQQCLHWPPDVVIATRPILQRGVESGGLGHEKVDSSDESSEEETAELRSTSGRHALHHPGDSDTASHHSSSAGTEDCSGRTLQCAAVGGAWRVTATDFLWEET